MYNAGQYGNPIGTDRTDAERGAVLPCPSPDIIRISLSEWERTEPASAYAHAAERVFSAFPLNMEIEDVLPKVSVLNVLCSMHIRAVYRVARNIVQRNIDGMLREGNPEVCAYVACVPMRDGREYCFYSFASKYLAGHRPEIFPEYDASAVRALTWYRDHDGFADFLMKELADYPRFMQIMDSFRKRYSLEEFSLRDIHRFLWLTDRRFLGGNRK